MRRRAGARCRGPSGRLYGTLAGIKFLVGRSVSLLLLLWWWPHELLSGLRLPLMVLILGYCELEG